MEKYVEMFFVLALVVSFYMLINFIIPFIATILYFMLIGGIGYGYYQYWRYKNDKQNSNSN